jgi:hypothetical protein
LVEHGKIFLPVKGTEHRRVVTDQQQSRTLIAAQTPQQLKSLHRSGGIQVARGFVRQHHARPTGQSASQSHALLLPDGQLMGPVLEAMFQAQGHKQLFRQCGIAT